MAEFLHRISLEVMLMAAENIDGVIIKMSSVGLYSKPVFKGHNDSDPNGISPRKTARQGHRSAKSNTLLHVGKGRMVYDPISATYQKP